MNMLIEAVEPMSITFNNRRSIAIVKIMPFHGCTKHVEIQYHFIQ